jgi:hypothetical protein
MPTMASEWMPWATTIGLLLGVGFAVYGLSTFFDRRRTEAFTLAAQQLGFNYQHDGFPFPVGQVPLVPLFSKGRGHRFSHLLNGWTAGLDSVVFDYRYFAGRGKTSHTVQQSVAAYRWPFAIDLQLLPLTWKERLGALFGNKSIRFEDDPEFTERWHVQGTDQTAVRQFFTPAVRTYIKRNLETDAGDSWHLEANNGWVLMYQAEHRTKGSEVTHFIRTTSNVITGLVQLAGQHQTSPKAR